MLTDYLRGLSLGEREKHRQFLGTRSVGVYRRAFL